MKIDDLIKRLQEIKDKHGNLSVDAGGESWTPVPKFKVTSLSLDDIRKPTTVELNFDTGDYYFGE